MEWTNFGDVNPIEHGGIWIKKDSAEFPNCFYIVKWTPVDYIGEDYDGTLTEGYVDLNDNWFDLAEVESYADLGGQTEENKEQYVMALFDYYSYENFSGSSSALKLKELYKALKSQGIEFEEI